MCTYFMLFWGTDENLLGFHSDGSFLLPISFRDKQSERALNRAGSSLHSRKGLTEFGINATSSSAMMLNALDFFLVMAAVKAQKLFSSKKTL
ncbi:hypothetical protein [Sphingobacterium paramultivorum]|uniref:hypothetical protein n=1 Tax=Sphingobacterium paramultivorum TaxID=2886510 RepID=UPI00129CE8DF|nr:hypothetical protein [Sphingobacterium paramultivorum]